MPVNTILGLFAKSPIKPLLEHINKVHQCCKLLVPFFEAVNANDWTEAERQRDKIAQIEREADELKREIRLKLPRGIFMPVERTDMLELLTQQDKIANKAKDIAGRILGRQMTLPESTKVDFMAYVKRCIDATNQAKKAINELEELLETGFKGREIELVDGMLQRLDEIEADTDRLQVKLRRQFQHVENQHSPIDMMFLYQILEWVGDLADQAERVGSRLELMLAR